MARNFKEKICKKESLIGVIGLGYVGLPLVREFLKNGFKVVGFDIDSHKVETLMKGESYIKHINNEFIKNAVSNKRFEATSDFTRLREVDVIIVCVPTPLGEHWEPDLSYLISTAEIISKNLRKGHIVVFESTTYPGTTDEEVLPILEKSGLKVGVDFYLGFSPEREDPGNKNYTTATIPKIVSGITENCCELIKALYDQIVVKTVPVSSTRVAEAVKLLENIYRGVNIALINELKMIFDKMNIDIWEVIEGAKTKPFGYQPFYPGPGLGGHCIPIDPFYLTWKAKEYDIATRFIELAGEINTSMPYYIVDKAIRALNLHGKSIKNASILVLGVSYKPDIDDMRESPALKIIKILMDEGAKVDYNDPFFPELVPVRKYQFTHKSVELTAENLKKFDLVIIVTNHSSYDYDFIRKNANLILDTRNAFGIKGLKESNIIKA
ncbi:MAG TPA: nucleotide sugar dehydrogenase [Candidatus Hydrothermia bacterium]|nr:nucleotide sugar dehydrogenase [Candidatus Hydrothermae bacterium]MDD3649232.1 nucleotide sugar dehydrogenase [Candidatus Hydrothermia bacterium]HOK22647.1 nucleotide sugar dehydrogenase [Candidatus Hydrothermia bacterium]HOL23356.1 nucleotide sugar dehydrogenase [Candidatus Hydrothermia bacterium]HOP32516.1 nucleotide sugar dehydrogenase [Candidatus Hydrothermia bacterium]